LRPSSTVGKFFGWVRNASGGIPTGRLEGDLHSGLSDWVRVRTDRIAVLPSGSQPEQAMGPLSEQGLIEAFVTKANNEALDDEGSSIPRHWSHFPNGQRPILIGFHSSATVLNKRTPHDRHSARQPWALQGSEQSRRFGFFFRLPIRFHIRKPIFYFGHFDQNGKILFTAMFDSLILFKHILTSDIWCLLYSSHTEPILRPGAPSC